MKRNAKRKMSKRRETFSRQMENSKINKRGKSEEELLKNVLRKITGILEDNQNPSFLCDSFVLLFYLML